MAATQGLRRAWPPRLLREPLLQLVDTDERYDETFDRFEYLTGLLLTDRRLASE